MQFTCGYFILVQGKYLGEESNDNQIQGGKNQMGTLKEEALAYEPKLTLNIADLDSVPIDLEIHKDGAGMDKDNKPFTYSYALLNEKEYRVPSSVLEEIQKILKLKPTVTKVKVTKTGTGLSTRYKVDALD